MSLTTRATSHVLSAGKMYYLAWMSKNTLTFPYSTTNLLRQSRTTTRCLTFTHRQPTSAGPPTSPLPNPLPGLSDQRESSSSTPTLPPFPDLKSQSRLSRPPYVAIESHSQAFVDPSLHGNTAGGSRFEYPQKWIDKGGGKEPNNERCEVSRRSSCPSLVSETGGCTAELGTRSLIGSA